MNKIIEELKDISSHLIKYDCSHHIGCSQCHFYVFNGQRMRCTMFELFQKVYELEKLNNLVNKCDLELDEKRCILNDIKHIKEVSQTLINRLD